MKHLIVGLVAIVLAIGFMIELAPTLPKEKTEQQKPPSRRGIAIMAEGEAIGDQKQPTEKTEPAKDPPPPGRTVIVSLPIWNDYVEFGQDVEVRMKVIITPHPYDKDELTSI